VVVAVRGGLLSLEDACRRYTLTVEEFLAWQRAIERFGLPGCHARPAIPALMSHDGRSERQSDKSIENRKPSG
jgi:hypothetical protein